MERISRLSGNNYCALYYLVCQSRVCSYLLLMQVHSQLLKMQRPELSGYMTGKSKIDQNQENLLGNTLFRNLVLANDAKTLAELL